MDSKRSWVTTILAILVLSLVGPRFPGARAQTQASCFAGYEWNKNSLGQDPCRIASLLEAACRGKALYTIPPLTSTQYYIAPQGTSSLDLLCECNTVMYSLYASCSTCQGALYLTWTSWRTACTTTYVAQYPHPVAPGTAIPQWAFYDVTSLPNQTYSDTVAISVGRNPESTPSAINTLSVTTSTTKTTKTSTTKTSTRPPSSGTSYPSPESDVSTSSRPNIAVIVGGVVGGVVPLILLAVVLTVVVQRRRRTQVMVSPQVQQVPNYYQAQPTSPTLTTASINHPYPTYQQNNNYAPQHQVRYSGMPEI